ncbi:hypothetical protein GCM10022409_49140 [Hymenobacter glaciei]|uniref:Uncharacterized protein n=1 Tax=Hymenobacter glaciei TaxID=877209 RepID=A0ABP7UZD2_9BACT
MKHLLLLLCLCLPMLAAVAPSALPPLQIAERFVASAGWAEMKDYLCCEVASQAKKQTLGQQIPVRQRRRCELIQQDSATAVVAVELRDSASRRDFYLHFRHDSTGWKLGAIRSLAMTHLGPPMVALLTGLPRAEVADYDRKHPDASHAFTVGNLRLWTSADADIAAHFHRHQADFQKLLRRLQVGKFFATPLPSPNEPAAEQAANADPAVHTLLRRLFLGRVTRRGTECGSCLTFVIGGKTNSSVGLLYQPEASSLPAMSPNGIIVLRPLGEGWYLYKTS